MSHTPANDALAAFAAHMAAQRTKPRPMKRSPIAEGVRRAFAGPIPSRLYTALVSWLVAGRLRRRP